MRMFGHSGLKSFQMNQKQNFVRSVNLLGYRSVANV